MTSVIGRLRLVGNTIYTAREFLFGTLFFATLLTGFAAISYRTLVSQWLGVSGVVWIPLVLLVAISVVMLIGYVSGLASGERFAFIATLSSLSLFAFLYYFRVSDTRISLPLGISIQTVLVAALGISTMLGVTVYFLLRHEVLPFVLRAALALLVLLSTFSFFKTIGELGSSSTVYTQDVLNLLINGFNSFPWLVLSSLALAFITRADIKVSSIRRQLPLLLTLGWIFFWVQLCVIFIGYSLFGRLSITYWQQTFVGFILWDAVYTFTTRLHDQTVEEQQHSLALGNTIKDWGYYLALLILVVFAVFWINKLLPV